MSSEPAPPSLSINLEYGDSPHKVCTVSPVDRYARFVAPHPDAEGQGLLTHNVSVLAIPDDIEKDWWNSPRSAYMRRKVRRAVKLGYEFRPFDFRDYRDDIHAINTSKEERQGRPMSAAYTAYPADKNPFRNQTCPRHRNEYVGVFQDGKLYAYSLLRQCGEMVLFSEIIGHGDRLDDGIMFLLVYETVKLRQSESRTKYAVYHLHDAGLPGLLYFKIQAGFSAYNVTWELGRPGVAVPTFEFDPENPSVLRVASEPPKPEPPAKAATKPARTVTGARMQTVSARPAAAAAKPRSPRSTRQVIKAGLRRVGLLGVATKVYRSSKAVLRRRPNHT